MNKIIKNEKNNLHPSVKKIFYIIGGFFLIFFVAVGYTIYIAQKNFEPVMDTRYYEKGLNYENRKKEFQNAKDRKWQVDVNFLKNDQIPKEFPLEIKFKNIENGINNFFSNPDRIVVDLKVSSSATIQNLHAFEFSEKEFKEENDVIILKKNINFTDLKNGLYEFRIELKPENDASMFFHKKIYIQ